MRKNTVARDPIGSTRNSITRRDRRSLRRRILEEADSGLKMDTDKIVGTNIFNSNVLKQKMNALTLFLQNTIQNYRMQHRQHVWLT